MAWSGFSQAHLSRNKVVCRNHRARWIIGPGESSGPVLARYSWPATSFPLSHCVVLFQRRPWSYCAKLARIQFGSGWPCQVWAKRIHFGSKPVCKNHWAHFWPTLRQRPLLAPSVCGPQMVCVCVCACVCGRNELEVCTMLAYLRISSFRTMLVLYAGHTCTHLQTLWGQRTKWILPTLPSWSRSDAIWIWHVYWQTTPVISCCFNSRIPAPCPVTVY